LQNASKVKYREEVLCKAVAKQNMAWKRFAKRLQSKTPRGNALQARCKAEHGVETLCKTLAK